MNRSTRDLIEEALGAWRPRDRSGAAQGHPAWFDLEPADRARVYEETVRLRALEAALDPEGLSSTGHAVMNRILRRV